MYMDESNGIELTRRVGGVVPDTHRLAPLGFTSVCIARLPLLLHRERCFGPFPLKRNDLGGKANGEGFGVRLVDGASDGGSTADGLLQQLLASQLLSRSHALLAHRKLLM